jgi:hypothetical protein
MISRDLPQDVVSYRLPRPAEPQITPSGFSACPAILLQGMSLAQIMASSSIYLVAYEQARIEARPSLLERDLLGVWN